MTRVTLDDTSLRDISLDNLERLKELRDLHFASRPEICVELPRLMTRYMKTIDDPDDPPELRAGKRLKYILENKRPIIEDYNLLAGTTTTKSIGVILYPDFLAQSIWPELETVHGRKKNPYGITAKEIEELNFEIFPYWMERTTTGQFRTILEEARRMYDYPRCQQVLERIVFFLCSKPYTISHTIPDYASVVNRGLNALKAEAEEIGDAELVVSSAFLLGYPCFFKGQFRKSIELFQKVVSIQEETGSISETFGLLVYPYVWSSAWLGYSHFTMGHFEDSLTYLENALETAMKLDDVLGQGICHMGIGLCLVLEGGSNWEKGIEHLEQAAGMLEKGGFAATVASDYGYLGWAYHLKQQPDKAIEYFEKCISMKKELAEVVDLALHYRNLAHLYLGLGDCQKALGCGEEALAVALKSESKWLEGLAYQALGGAYLNMSPPQYREAEKYLLDSIRLLEGVESRPYVLPSYRGLAVLYKERGELERARECVSRAISMCEEMGMQRDLAQARDVDV